MSPTLTHLALHVPDLDACIAFYETFCGMQAMEELMQGLPEGIAHEWSGQSFEERLSGAQAPALFALSVLIVFLALAALYESWSIPLAVILVVPLGVLGALLGVSLRGLPNDIYFKVGLITIIGLSAKNAILIIEVAKDHYQEGMHALVDAGQRICAVLGKSNGSRAAKALLAKA